MMTRRPLRTALAAVLLSAVGTLAQAAVGDFTFTTSVTPTTLPGLSGVVINLVPLDGPVSTNAAVAGGTDIVFGNITVDTSGQADNTTATLTNVAYTFSVTLKDLASNTTDVVNIMGTLSGTVTKNGSGAVSVNITNMYSPTMYSTKDFPPTYNFDLSNINTYVAPGASNAGSFGAHVQAPGVPEPASVVLLGLGGTGLALLARRRRLA